MQKSSLLITVSAVQIPTDGPTLKGELVVPEGARAIVVFSHASGNSRGSARARRTARSLAEAGFATLILDLLTAQEETVDGTLGQLRLDPCLLARRLTTATDWLSTRPETRGLRLGYLGDDAGSAAALLAATERPEIVGAIVSRGGRPDLAGDALARVRAPTLLVVGGNDAHVVSLNRAAMRMMTAQRELVIVPHAGHQFSEPGALEQVVQHARSWFGRHLAPVVIPEPKPVEECY